MTNARRILMVCEPGCYGVLMYVRSLIRHLHAAHPGLIVDYAFSRRRGSPELEDLVAEVAARGGQTLDLAVGNAPERADLVATRRLRELIGRHRPDVIHAHSSKAGALVRLLAWTPGFPPILYTPHGYYGMSRRGGNRDRVFNAIESLLGRFGRTHNVSIHEHAFARNQLRVPAGRALLIFAGVDLARFRPASPAEKAAARCALGLPAEGRLLVTVGRDAYEKNYADLYAALADVLPGAGWHFAHAGEGAVERRAALPPAARAAATAIPFLADPETLYRAADGFVLVSRSEAFGLAAYEAAACGLPLLLTATMGLLSLRQLGVPGIRWLPNPAEHGDISGVIAGALREWAGDPAPRVERAPQIARWFDERVQFDKLARVYAALADGRRVTPADFADHPPNPLSSAPAGDTLSA